MSAAEATLHERIVLGAMLLNSALVDELTGLGLVEESFWQEPHRMVWRSILAAREAGEPTEPVALGSRLAAAGHLTRIGGLAYLHTLVESVPTAANGAYYARKVLEQAQWRTAQQVHDRFGQLLEQPGTRSAAEVRESVRAMLDEMAVDPAAGDPVPWADLIRPGLDEIEAAGTPDGSRRRIPTGFTDLDKLLGGGLGDGELIQIAGRTGMGKSVLARGIAAHAAFHEKVPAVVFTLEMTRQEVFEAVLSARTRIPHHNIKTGALNDQDWTTAARFVADTVDVPLFVDDTPTITLPEIAMKCRRLKQRYGQLGPVVVDYLQLMTSPKRVENRQQEVSALSRGLKLLAKELECSIVGVSQLNRSPDQRGDKRPQLSDLRESGSLEQDANVVVLLYREDYYDKESPRAGEADFIVAKHRGGATDTVTVAAQLHLSRFVDMAIP